MKYCPYCMNELTDDITICPKCGRNITEYQHPAHILKQGALLNNRYLIGGMIGEGGFGITYIGLDTLLQYRVAVKEFFPNGMVNRNNTVSNEVMSISTETAKEVFSKSRENFLREARTLAKFSNESGIVAVKDFFEENHTVYIVMEYLDGITLKQYLAKVGTISPYNTVCLLMPVFHSLQKIHEKKLIHRDISPDNIMLVDEQVKLLDFGAAREFADEKSLSVMLKHGYAPMEQYRRHGIQGAWTDVYAICATMYKCITGKIPPDAPDRVFEDELKMPSEFGIEIDPTFEAVLRHGLAIKPDERIQSIEELLEELDRVPGIDINVRQSANVPAETATPSLQNTPAEKTVSSAPEKPDDDVRLSEYVPHIVEDAEVKPKPPVSQYDQTAPTPPAPAPENVSSGSDQAPTEKKPKNKSPLVVGAVVAGVAVAGIAVAVGVSMGNNKPVQQSSDTASQSASSVDESSKDTASETHSSADESKDSPQSSAESKTESKEESKPESKTESSSPVSEVSKPESSAEKSEVSEPSAESSAERSEEPILVTFPDLKNYFSFDYGMLKMDYSLFGKNYDTITSLFKPGTLYMSETHPLYGDTYTILYIPIKTSRNTENYLDSIDLFFLDDALVSVEFESPTPFDKDVAMVARERLGDPSHEEKDDMLWMFNDKDVNYALYMKTYPETSNSSSEVYFTQKYFSSAATVG